VRLARERRDPVHSEIEQWSNIAFTRLTMGNINFELLQQMEDRSDELNNYLNVIEELLDQKEQGAAQN